MTVPSFDQPTDAAEMDTPAHDAAASASRVAIPLTGEHRPVHESVRVSAAILGEADNMLNPPLKPLKLLCELPPGNMITGCNRTPTNLGDGRSYRWPPSGPVTDGNLPPRHVIDAQCHEIASAQFAVDRQVEEG
jgi:hypothetical protein